MGRKRLGMRVLLHARGRWPSILGSGVSRDAGVPTGHEVLREGLRKLQRVETASDAPLDDEALDAGVAQTGRGTGPGRGLLAAYSERNTIGQD